MKKIQKQLLNRIYKLEIQSNKLRRTLLRSKKTSFCIENTILWLKLITVIGSLLLLLWTISDKFFSIK